MTAARQHQTAPRSDERFTAPHHRHLFHFAAEYVDRGWSVIPLCGKQPAIASWLEYRSRRPTYDELQTWFGQSHGQDHNVGIITGRLSELVVIDCDRPEAIESWRQAAPSSPLVVRTGGGGAHIYYRMPKDDIVGNRVRVGGQALDVRGEGGYVVAPPSRHASGLLYEWTAPYSDYSLDDLPRFDATWLAREPRRERRAAAEHRVQHASAYIRKIVAVAGQRGHDQTYKAACILREAGLKPEEALAELVAWNETNAQPPWSLRELLHKVQSAYQRS